MPILVTFYFRQIFVSFVACKISVKSLGVRYDGMIKTGPNIAAWVTNFVTIHHRTQIHTKKTHCSEESGIMVMMFFANGAQRLSEEIGEIEVG